MRVLLALALMSGFHEAKPLEPAATFVAHKPAVVWCANSDSAWRAFVSSRYGDNFDTHGSADVQVGQMYLDPLVCKALSMAAKAPLQTYTYPTLAPSIEVVTHEAIHLRGELVEGVTDCDAMHEMPGVAVKFFHVTAGKKLRGLMAEAWGWHRKLSASYQSVC